MRVKLLKPWSGRLPGHVFGGMHLGMARSLIERGFAEETKEEKSKPSNRNLSAKSIQEAVAKTRLSDPKLADATKPKAKKKKSNAKKKTDEKPEQNPVADISGSSGTDNGTDDAGGSKEAS